MIKYVTQRTDLRLIDYTENNEELKQYILDLPNTKELVDIMTFSSKCGWILKLYEAWEDGKMLGYTSYWFVSDKYESFYTDFIVQSDKNKSIVSCVEDFTDSYRDYQARSPIYTLNFAYNAKNA